MKTMYMVVGSTYQLDSPDFVYDFHFSFVQK